MFLVLQFCKNCASSLMCHCDLPWLLTGQCNSAGNEVQQLRVGPNLIASTYVLQMYQCSHSKRRENTVYCRSASSVCLKTTSREEEGREAEISNYYNMSIHLCVYPFSQLYLSASVSTYLTPEVSIFNVKS